MARIYVFAKPDLADPLTTVLSMHGHDPICSDEPRVAFRQIITFRPRVVLAEYLDLDGEWLCREIRKLPQLKDTQVIMMSEMGQHMSTRDFESMVLAFGANGYLRKPFDYREIGNYATSWLRAS